ncbi:MAG: radical SAM family heme chaperone HemW [Melioribacteraceae bacterium]|nr:radical SAM family heme chaperone HemW [Melioribacteraceae bacterium]
MKETSIYIHIPFCDHKCIYCDFYSITRHDDAIPFQKALLKEISNYAQKYSKGRIIKSIFFGGGTPSLMEPDYIKQILDEIRERYCVAEDAEITLETNPGTVNEDKINSFYKAGINRLSIGIQSFDEKDLKFLTRIHNRETAIDTVKQAYNSGFENISIDLIFNLPNQTKEKFLRNLNEAINLPIKHISAYSLILEQGTLLNKMVLDGKVKIADEDYDAEIYEETIRFLDGHGFKQYEVSNFAKPGYESIHNKAYWHYHDYISFGPSAHSFVDGKRWWNRKSLRAYIKDINKSGEAIVGEELPNKTEMFDEYVMLALRSNGIDVKDFEFRFGSEWLCKNYAEFKNLESKNLLSLSGDRICLTSKGYAVCDELIMNLLK